MRNMKRAGMLLATMVFSLSALCGADKVKADSSKKNDVILDGVYIGSVDVGGMTKQEAATAVDDYVKSLKDSAFKLSGENGSIDATAQQMSITADSNAAAEEALAYGKKGNLIDRYEEVAKLKSGKHSVNMHLSVDKQITAKYIYDNKATLEIAATDSTLERTESGFNYVPGTEGKEIDVVKSVYAINDFLSNEWDGSSNEIKLVSNVVEPRGSEEELGKIKDNLGSFSTDFSSSASGRAANVRNACSLINGSIVYPGEEFSVYQAISPITTDNGYAIAGAYENGQVVESVGGGVCQVATTLYNAIIRAELDVTQRFNHSMIVSYVSPSDDAAIAGTYKDLKFKNNLSSPIYIEGYCSGGIITFTIYGEETRPANREISFRSETLSETNPDTQFKYDASQPLGYYHVEQSAHRGVVARLWKTVKVNGVVESEEIFNNSTYNASPKIVTVGTGGATPESLSALQAAVATRDEAAVKSTAASAKAAQEQAALQQQQQQQQQQQPPADPNAGQQAPPAQPTDPNAGQQPQ